MNRERCLDVAKAAVMERGRAYGPPGPFYAHLAKGWSWALGHPVTPVQVVLCLTLLKVARLVFNPKHEDSAVDIAGYAACLAEVMGQEARTAEGRTGTENESARTAGGRTGTKNKSARTAGGRTGTKNKLARTAGGRTGTKQKPAAEAEAP